MSKRQVKLVLLCEDRQHEAFARRYAVLSGWHPRAIRVERSPKGSGSGEQWVRECFPKELSAYRANHVATTLVVVVDADRLSVSERVQAFDGACDGARVARRNADDRVAFIVPKRNIETWFAYLSGTTVNEDDIYPRLGRERDCVNHVKTLRGMCGAGQMREPTPPSLQTACVEYNSRVHV